jgi:hypothetical protein
MGTGFTVSEVCKHGTRETPSFPPTGESHSFFKKIHVSLEQTLQTIELKVIYSFNFRKKLTKHLFQECLPTRKASKVQLIIEYNNVMQ